MTHLFNISVQELVHNVHHLQISKELVNFEEADVWCQPVNEFLDGFRVDRRPYYFFKFLLVSLT